MEISDTKKENIRDKLNKIRRHLEKIATIGKDNNLIIVKNEIRGLLKEFK